MFIVTRQSKRPKLQRSGMEQRPARAPLSHGQCAPLVASKPAVVPSQLPSSAMFTVTRQEEKSQAPEEQRWYERS
jgi:hypothetical protein